MDDVWVDSLYSETGSIFIKDALTRSGPLKSLNKAERYELKEGNIYFYSKVEKSTSFTEDMKKLRDDIYDFSGEYYQFPILDKRKQEPNPEPSYNKFFEKLS